MRKSLSVFLFSVILVIAVFQSGIYSQSTKKYDYTDFNSISVGWGMHLKVTQSNNYFIELKGDDADLKVIKVEKSGDEVKFYVPKNNYRMHNDVYITVNLPELTQLELSGGSKGDLSMDIKSKSFEFSLSGGSTVDGKLNSGNTKMTLSGGSIIELSGKCGDIEISGSGGSIFKLKNFMAKNTDCDLSGGSQVEINMDGKLSTDQSGGSRVTYYGNVKIGRTHFSGGSYAEQGD